MTKKSWIVLAVLSIAVLSFAVAAPVLAASGSGNSRGTQGGYGRSSAMGTAAGVPVQQEINLNGALDELFHSYIAAGLGIPVEELEARLEAGETVAEIGLSLGYDLDAIREILSQARLDALDQAVLDGLLTQDQADWLASRGNHMQGNGTYDGTCDEDCSLEGSMVQQSQRRGRGR